MYMNPSPAPHPQRENDDVEAGVIHVAVMTTNDNNNGTTSSCSPDDTHDDRNKDGSQDEQQQQQGTAPDIPKKRILRKRTSTGTCSTSTTLTCSSYNNDSVTVVPPELLEDLPEDNINDDGDDGTHKNKPMAEDDSVTNDDHDNTSNHPSTTKRTCCFWRWCKRVLGGTLLLGLLLLFSVLIGARIERWTWSHATPTTPYYQGKEMCAMDPSAWTNDNDNTSNATGQTFASVAAAHDAHQPIVHCGACGQCSTAHDLHILAKTRATLTQVSTHCAFSIFLGMRTVDQCLQERVGFTPACHQCWIDNIQCSFRHCKFTCIKYKLFRQDNNQGDDEEALNDCLQCDELMCGPAFVECSGSNRRRMGIVSDIGRKQETEQCPHVDVDWIGMYPY